MRGCCLNANRHQALSSTSSVSACLVGCMMQRMSWHCCFVRWSLSFFLFHVTHYVSSYKSTFSRGSRTRADVLPFEALPFVHCDQSSAQLGPAHVKMTTACVIWGRSDAMPRSLAAVLHMLTNDGYAFRSRALCLQCCTSPTRSNIDQGIL